MRPSKSKVWSFFIRLDSERNQCKFCLSILKNCKNTSSMLKHIRIKHPTKFSQLGIKSSSASDSGESCVVDDPLGSEENVNSTIPSPTSSTSSSVPSCSKTMEIPIMFKNVSSMKEGGQKHAAITNNILFFICKDNRPFHIVNGEGFKKMIKVMVPNYKIPSTNTLKKLMEEKYVTFKELHKKKFETIQAFSITSDIWTETMSMKSYLGVTVHYIQDNKIESCNIATRELSERHTQFHLSEKLSAILSEWGISMEQIVAVITDNGHNIVKAVTITDGLGAAKHLPCFAHTLNLVAEKLTKHATIEPIITKVRQIVIWIKGSVVNSDLFRKKQRDNGVAEGDIKKMILDVKTRWNSCLYMLKRFLEVEDIIDSMMYRNASCPPVVHNDEVTQIKIIISLLEPLEFMSKIGSGDKYVTISMVIPMLYCFYEQIGKVQSEGCITEFKNELVKEMDRRFGGIEMVGLIATATLLDPRFKNLNFRNPIACGSAISRVKRLLANTLPTVDPAQESMPLQENAEYSEIFWSHHTEMARSSEARKESNGNCPDQELFLYLRQPVAPLDSNPLDAWTGLRTMFPNLAKLATKHLSIVATSVPSERLFSKAGQTMSQARNRLAPKKMEKLLFLSGCKEEEWFS